MHIASSQTNHQEISKKYLQWVCDIKLEGVAAEHLAGHLRCQPRSSPGLLAPGVSTEEEAAHHHAEDGGENVAENKGEREKNEGKSKHFNDDLG